MSRDADRASVGSFVRGAALPLIGIALLTLAAPAARAEAGPAAEVDRYVRAEMARRRIPGLALLIARGHRVVHAAEFGVANVER